jgi:uncharacterized protein
MKVYLHEITEQDTLLDFTEEDAWVVEAVERADEPEPENVAPAKSPKRAAEVHFNLRKVDDVVIASGQVKTEIKLLCSRCANPFRMPASPSFSALFCKDPDMAGIAHLEKPGGARSPGKPVGQNKGFARHAHDFDEDQAMADGKDLDITYLSSNYIDLSEILSEQLQLQVPFQPLCREDCKGICPQCGADQNVGRCACSKIKKSSPFAVLQKRL